MLLKTLASTIILLSSLSFIPAVSGAPQISDAGTLTTSPLSSTIDSVTASASEPACSACDDPTSSNSTSGGGSSSNSTTSSNSTSSGAQFVIYSDKSVDGIVPDVSKVEGYTVFALSFLLNSGPTDQAKSWASLDASTRQSIKSKYNAAGIKLIVSAFGSTESPTTNQTNPKTAAETMAKWVKQHDLDGIDVDYEDTTAMNLGDGKAEAWLTTFTATLRAALPQGQYILTHAPMAPWFSPSAYKGGAYVTVNKIVGDMIDWYNVQFYNQNDYNDCDSLLNTAKNTDGTSLFQIANAGIEKNKLVIGKPANNADASNGYMDPQTFAGCLSQAKQNGWNAGAMVWEYPDADSTWIKTVRGSAFP